MFRRERHHRLLELLAAFDSGLLSRCRFLFGGGTRIVLELDEYRESLDIDFLCSDAEGYAEVRFQASSRGYDSLFRADARRGFHLPREMRIDQYGIRFPVEMEGSLIRVELIREARIALDAGVRPDWSPVDCLALDDCFAEKLLANSDRWPDRQVLSRDLIDLGALRRKVGSIPSSTWAKVEPAYKAATRDDLRKALAAFLGDSAYRRRCFEGLRIEEPDEILAGMGMLLQDSGDPPSQKK
jgi:hypothetical protein